MNSKIKILVGKLEELKHGNRAKEAEIRLELQRAYSKVFDNDKALEKAIANAENASMYQFNRYGEIESWYRYADLSDIPEDAREYFENWLQDQNCMRVDWDNDCLLVGHGDDNLIIQDDTPYGRDNGVWQSGKLVIAESEYKDDDSDTGIDETKRNALIEAHMERTGYFPGVFRATQYGDVFPVDTRPKNKDGAA